MLLLGTKEAEQGFARKKGIIKKVINKKPVKKRLYAFKVFNSYLF
jgi:hypothetical protein